MVEKYTSWGDRMAGRKRPIKHIVRSYHRRGRDGTTFVHTYVRGSGSKATKVKTSPKYLVPKENYKVMSPDKSHKYMKYVEKSLHGDLKINRTAGPVCLKLTTVNRDQLDFFTSSRPDFEESVQYHMDEIRNGKTISPILVHKLPSGRFAILDGNARVEAYRRLNITSYPAIENSFADTISKIGSGVKKAAKKGGEYLVKGATKFVDVAKRAAIAGSKVATEMAKKGATTGVETVRESAVGAWEKAEQGNVRNLINTALYSTDQVKRTFARSTLRNFYPDVYKIMDFPKLDRTEALQRIAMEARAEHQAIVSSAPE
jgi:hypothetical protein